MLGMSQFSLIVLFFKLDSGQSIHHHMVYKPCFKYLDENRFHPLDARFSDGIFDRGCCFLRSLALRLSIQLLKDNHKHIVY